MTRDIPRFANGTLLYFLHSFQAVLCKKGILSIVYCSKSNDFVHYSDLTAQNDPVDFIRYFRI